MFQDVPGNVRFPELEEEVLRFWKEQRIYEKSLDRRADAPKFIFYEGPPTANGMPHPGHCLTRAMKDLFPRYRTMRGYLCERKGGWDTHGLPVEIEVCKELGIHSKEEIEEFGIEPFIHKCQQSVWRYMKEWERLTERLGFWIHLDEAYATYHQSYVESVWWSLKNLFERGLLYQGHKIVWWWAQGGTALSNGEVGEGYREVADPSVYVRFPLVDEPNTSLLVWTTTPWTLLSNQFIAVKPDLEYATVVDSKTGDKLILAAALVDTIAGKVKRDLTVESTCNGTDLLGRRYLPPFDFYHADGGQRTGKLKEGGQQHLAWRVVAAPFVTTESGTGIVHQAPAFGEVDYDVLVEEQDRFVEGDGPQLINAVAPNGKFTSEAPDFEGRWVKEADKDITRALREMGVLYHQEQYLHDYPFCPRAEQDALIQYPRRGWFIRTTQFKDRLLANNQKINWLPDHIRDGRMGNFLETNVDWALSRERYWGTPLPIWVCSETGKMEAVSSYDELLDKPGISGTEVWESARREHPDIPDDLRIHKPYIDAITYDSPFAAGSRMNRVPEVIDCWYDAGAMPFAQWGYPHTGREQFEEQFPADFISEALDQTRGWFYALLAISTLTFGDDDQADTTLPSHAFPHPFANCIVLGLMLAESYICAKCQHRHLTQVKKCEECGGKVERKIEKMSKRLRNYREPQEIFDRYGADALRWYFFANQAPWNSIIYSERAIKESIPEFLLRLWNCFSFFVIYANIDGFDPSDNLDADLEQLNPVELAKANSYRPVAERSELDRWILSELNRTVGEVVQQMDAYDNFGACQRLNEFVDGLSNWFVRRSRDRFWGKDKQSTDKVDAYWTLYECLLTTSKLIAPFIPFVAESLWRNLTNGFAGRALESVHLCDYPASDSATIDTLLSERMELLREIASLGRSARANAKLKVRQPLASVEVILADTQHQSWLEEHDELLRDELNVKSIEYTKEADKYITYEVQPNFKRVGPRVGSLMPKVKAALAQSDGGVLLSEMNEAGKVTLDIDGESVELDQDDIQIRLKAKAGWTAAQGSSCVVVLSTELTPQLVREGNARDLVRLIQERRKELDCEYTDRIEVGLKTDSDELRTGVEENHGYICRETLAVNLTFDSLAGVTGVEHSIGEFAVTLFVKVVA
ncbi:MAG: isoleucine--tRNA ligase [Planctomycetes bacterium]|nr:isoleucine--tRNA ligase [Planctomycetota bacterium]